MNEKDNNDNKQDKLPKDKEVDKNKEKDKIMKKQPYSKKIYNMPNANKSSFL